MILRVLQFLVDTDIEPPHGYLIQRSSQDVPTVIFTLFMYDSFLIGDGLKLVPECIISWVLGSAIELP